MLRYMPDMLLICQREQRREHMRVMAQNSDIDMREIMANTYTRPLRDRHIYIRQICCYVIAPRHLPCQRAAARVFRVITICQRLRLLPPRDMISL